MIRPGRRSGVLAVLCAAALLAAAPAALAAHFDSSLRLGPPAPWVDQAADASLPSAAQAAGASIDYLLLDRQENVGAQEYYHREVIEIRSAAGVQEGSALSVVYDPSFQVLILHHVQVLRGAEASSRLSRQAVHLLRREPSLESQMLDGSLTASILLEDVRPGDRIDWAYTVRGRNPVFAGTFSDSYSMGWGVPLGRARTRILCPSSRGLRVQVLGGTIEAAERRVGKDTEYTWLLENVPAVVTEDRTPPWHLSAPWLLVTEFEDWARVASWASSLYPRAALPAELERLADGWNRQHSFPADRALAALEWVQQNIRYVGIELGVGSYKPRSPAVVFARRFGDCKDQSYLLCALLARMGISAQPVLVNTWSGRLLGKMLPTPAAFNHVVVRMRIGVTDVLVDPTLSFQRGALEERAMPDYGYGLVVAEGSRELLAFGGARGRTARVDVVNRVTAHGRGEPADFQVETHYTGEAADDARQYAATRRPEEMARIYLNYYAARYPGIESTGLLQVEDDPVRNVVRIVESYRLTGFWEAQPGSEAHKANLYADSIMDALPSSQTKIRRTPMLIRHPFEVIQRLEVKLPEQWAGTSESSTFTNPAFQLTVDRRHHGDSFTITWTYRSLAATVSAADAQLVQKAVLDLDPELGYRLTWGTAPADGGAPGLPAALPLAVALVTAAALVAGGIALARRTRPAVGIAAQQAPQAEPAGPRGLGGLLVLVGISLVSTPVVSIVSLVALAPAFSAQAWQALLAEGGGTVLTAAAAYNLFLLVSDLVLIGGSVLLLVFYFQRRRAFRAGYIAMRVVGAGVSAVSLAASWLLLRSDVAPKTTSQIVATIVGAVIWILYMRRSARVANTFVR